MSAPNDTELVERLLVRQQQADTYRQQMSMVWKALGDFARPSRATIHAPQGTTPQRSGMSRADKHTRLFDTTLIKANNQHAAGYKAWMSPASTPWFQLEPPAALRMDDECASWYARVTEITSEMLSLNNFHAEDFEALLDGGAFGTRCVFADVGTRSPVFFQCWEVDTYSILEDKEGYVDTVFHTYEYTPRQAAQEFGEEALPQATRDKLANAKDSAVKEVYVHCVYPREDAERDKMRLDGPNMPVASVWLHMEAKHLVRKSGYQEMPAICSRYLKWSGTPYGLPPAVMALADARQLNVLQMDLDILASIAARPRLLLPDSMEGEVNLQPGGVTLYQDPQRLPRTWGTENRYDIGQDRVKMRQQMISDAFNLDAFQAFRQRRDKAMTAAEVYAVQAEALDLFSPTFNLSANEHYTPILQRVFGIMLRGGHYPPVPRKLLQPMANGTGFVPPPQVTYTGKLALALKTVNVQAFDKSIERRVNIANEGGLGASAFDDLNIPVALRNIDRMQGIPDEWLRKPEEVQQIQAERAKQQQQQEQMEQAQAVAGAAGKLKGTGLLPQQAGQAAA